MQYQNITTRLFLSRTISVFLFAVLGFQCVINSQAFFEGLSSVICVHTTKSETDKHV